MSASRFLLVTSTFPSRVLNLRTVGRALQARGHQVAWVANPEHGGSYLPDDERLFPSPVAPSGGSYDTSRYHEVRGLRGYQALVEDILMPLARGMVPAVEEAIGAFDPDLLVADRYAWAGGLAARRLEIPWATLETSLGARHFGLRTLPFALEWTDEKLRVLQEEHGLEPVEAPDLSGRLDLVFTSPALAGEPEDAPDSLRMVGPVCGSREPDDASFPWEELGNGPNVLVSLGTLESRRGERFYRVVGEALSDFDGTVVVVAPEGMGPFPESFIVRSWVPQLRLLPHMDAVLTHAGTNTVHETLLEGVPLVVAPIMNDQPHVATKVVEAGAGIRVSFVRASPEEVREAVEGVLSEPEYRRRAEAIGEALAEEGGLDRAVELLEAEAAGG